MIQKELDGYVSYSCPECSESFPTEMGVKVHIGKKHGGAGVTVECSNCGETKEAPAYEARTYNHHFCGTGCKGQFQGETGKLAGHSGNSGYQSTAHACAVCGEFYFRKETDPQDTEWCSRECQIEGLAERAKYRTGPDAPQWRGGTSTYLALRKTFGNRTWEYIAEDYRQSVNNQCEWCGEESPQDRSLDVHHIVPIRTGGSHHRDNLMALCRSCHGKAESFSRDLFGDVLIDDRHTQPLNGHISDNSKE